MTVRHLTLGPEPAAFIWATGIEDTFVPQARPGQRPLDEYELIGHYEHWREDLAAARELGVSAIRWGVPWYRVEPRPGQFDWAWIDQVIPYIVEELGLIPIIDLMHYGTPLWLEGSFAAPEYPRAVAAYAAAFAERYRGLVRAYTPLNEPLVNADFCGRRGVWPPYLRGDSGFVRVMIQLARGIQATVAALKAIDPAALMVHVEATGVSLTDDEELQPLADEEQLRRFLALDLITGRVTTDHSLYTWLLRSGARLDHLRELRRDAIGLELLGLNFYPQWSSRRLAVDSRGRLSDRATDHSGTGFADLILRYYRRYQAPLMITETSAVGSDHIRSAWLESSLAALRGLRGRGVPVLGYTWFPLFTMIDWRYRHGRGPIERYHLDLGMYTLGAGRPRWRPTPLVEQFRRAIDDPGASIGPLDPMAAGAHTHGEPPYGIQLPQPGL